MNFKEMTKKSVDELKGLIDDEKGNLLIARLSLAQGGESVAKFASSIRKHRKQCARLKTALFLVKRSSVIKKG